MYTIKVWQELGWAIFVAVLVEVFNVLSGLHPEAVTDWRTWGIVAIGGLARAAAVAGLAAVGKARITAG